MKHECAGINKQSTHQMEISESNRLVEWRLGVIARPRDHRIGHRFGVVVDCLEEFLVVRENGAKRLMRRTAISKREKSGCSSAAKRIYAYFLTKEKMNTPIHMYEHEGFAT